MCAEQGSVSIDPKGGGAGSGTIGVHFADLANDQDGLIVPVDDFLANHTRFPSKNIYGFERRKAFAGESGGGGGYGEEKEEEGPDQQRPLRGKPIDHTTYLKLTVSL